jgi:glutaredoxin-like protein NrdH
MMKITIWEKPNCVACQTTKRQFDQRGIIYTVRRLDRSAKAIQRFLDLGLTAAPIVETDDRRWSGFRLDRIKSLEYHLKSERAHGVNVPLEPIKQIAEEVEDESL